MIFFLKLITFIPSDRLSEIVEIGNNVPEQVVYDGLDENAELRKGQVLWLRGIARLQTQVNNYPTIFLLCLIY